MSQEALWWLLEIGSEVVMIGVLGLVLWLSSKGEKREK
jgi:hypothetical protein